MAESHLVYKLDGDIAEIDVFTLAPTLLALGALIQDSNRVLFPKGQDVGVNVKPFREGSFVVDLTLFSPTHLQQLIEFLTPHSIEQLKVLLECIGLVETGIAGTTVGAIQVIKWLGGKPKKVEEISPGEFRYTARDDRSIGVKGNVHTLLSNCSVTQNIVKIYTSPLADAPGVEQVRTYIEGHEKEAVVVKRQEVPAIRDFGSAEEFKDPTEIIKELLHPGVFLNPKRGAFGDDPKDWSFWHGDQIITATVRDKDFLARHARGDIRLNESDLLTVDLLERQKLKGTKVQKPTYEIIRVIEYQRGDGEPAPGLEQSM
jgi:hypothetical protein